MKCILCEQPLEKGDWIILIQKEKLEEQRKVHLRCLKTHREEPPVPPTISLDMMEDVSTI